jgi:hypothetical protein
LLVLAAPVYAGLTAVVVLLPGKVVGVTTDGIATDEAGVRAGGASRDGEEASGIEAGTETGTEAGATEVGIEAGIEAGTDAGCVVTAATSDVSGATSVTVPVPVGTVTITVVGVEPQPVGHAFAVVVKPGGTPPEVASAGQ